MILKTKHGHLDFSSRAYVMGIVNVTPDSFYDGGRYESLSNAVERGIQLAGDGADLLDIGGESTRPGADAVPAGEELNRVIPVIQELRKKLAIPISVDTRKAEVARAGLEAGADLINDISGLMHDPDMVRVACGHACPVIVMHMQGHPKTMQDNPVYEDVIAEIKRYFVERSRTLQNDGIASSDILIDPGIGFGKRLQDNLRILNELESFSELGFPIVIGPSRKRFIGDILHLPVEERLEGTAAAVAVAVLRGANIVRVHDVREIVRVMRTVDAIMRQELHESFQK